MLKHKLLTSFMVVNALVTLSISSVTFASTPHPQPGCPDGWVPAPNPKIGCIPNKIRTKQPVQENRRIRNTTPSSRVKFPPEIPQEFRINKCKQGVIDPVDCPENNPIPVPRD